MKNIWVESLNCGDVLLFLYKDLFSKITVLYDGNAVSARASFLLTFLNKHNFGKNIRPANLTLGVKDPMGYAIKYTLESNLDACIDRFLRSRAPAADERLRATTRCYLASYLLKKATFITMVEAKDKFKNSAAGISNILYLKQHPLNIALFEYYREKGYRLTQSFYSRDSLKYYLRPVYHVIKIVVALLDRSCVMTSITTIKPSIWIQYCKGKGPILDFAFWREHIDRNNFDIVNYLDGKEDGSQLVISHREIERRGFKWIDLKFHSLLKASRLGMLDLARMLDAFLFCPVYHALWFRIYRFEYRMWFLLYRSVFIKFKVRALIQYQEYSWVQEAQAMAIKEANGIMIGLHWSNFAFWQEPQIFAPHQVYFVWNKIMHDKMQKNGNLCRHILPSGLWLIDNGKDDKSLASFAKKFRFCVSIFDSSIGYNALQSPGTLSEFYLLILRLLDEHKDWGGIVKSKYLDLQDFRSLPNGEEIHRMMASLLDSGRLVILDVAEYPSVASRYSDLSVCYAINTAGIITGIYGRRAVHWDCAGLLMYPVYRDRNQKVFYTTLHEFKEAIMKASEGDISVGNFSQRIRYFNYFNDFSAANRVGRFIQSYMETSAKSGNYQENLDRLVNKYLEENEVSKDFFMAKNVWDCNQ